MTTRTGMFRATGLFAATLALAAGSREAMAVAFDEGTRRTGGSRLAAGAQGEHTCFVMGDGTVRCWGRNAEGQLGDGTGTTPLVPAPVRVSGLTDVTAVAAGARHSCALRADGTVRCWGDNTRGQLGNGTTTDAPRPVPVRGALGSSPGSAKAVATGGQHSCALRTGGTVECWGANNEGQLGDRTAADRLTPVPVAGLSVVVAITAGPAHTCAVQADGTVQCWGRNDRGQLGDGTRSAFRPTPALVPNVRASTVTAGQFHTCTLTATGRAFCWGGNGNGQLGDGTTEDRFSPGLVAGLGDLTDIAAGGTHTCAQRMLGDAFCWGSNLNGQLGNGTTVQSLTPVEVSSPVAVGLALTAGLRHTCAVRSNSTTACWGDNENGEVGNGTTIDRPLPTAVTGGGSAVAVAIGANHSCTQHVGATAIRCWGSNELGQLGDGSGTDHLVPATEVIGVAGAQSVATGIGYSCAVLSRGNVRCWGGNEKGNLGDGTTIDRPTPVPVSGLTNVVAVSAGGGHTCALHVDGTLSCWGSNSVGQLGDGTTIDQLTPVPVGGLKNVIAVTAGVGHTCAVRADGAAFCWGLNFRGELGDGTTTDRPAPVPVEAITNAVAISAEFLYTCARLSDGTARCWGANEDGQLGNGTTDNQPSPVPVSALASLVGLSTGISHTCALRADGRPFCWGDNGSGAVGDGGDAGDRPEPVAVPSFAANIDPDVVLFARGRVARVHALVNCPRGQWVQVQIDLTQGEVAGKGMAVGACTGGVEAYEVFVLTGRHAPFEPGPAVAAAHAVVRRLGHETESHEWTRNVELR